MGIFRIEITFKVTMLDECRKKKPGVEKRKVLRTQALSCSKDKNEGDRDPPEKMWPVIWGEKQGCAFWKPREESVLGGQSSLNSANSAAG